MHGRSIGGLAQAAGGSPEEAEAARFGANLASGALSLGGGIAAGMRAGTQAAGRGLAAAKLVETGALFNPGKLEGVERASQTLLESVESKRAITWAAPGSDAERFLNLRGAEAAAFGPEDVLLRPNPSKAAVLEEFLHGTQNRLGIVDRLGTSGLGSAETHVKDFMIRHQNMLGLGAEDVQRIQTLRDMGL